MELSLLQATGGILSLALSLAMLVTAAFAFADALGRRAQAYLAADKLTKPAWCIILGLGLAVQLITPGPLGLLNLVGITAALVYLVDARPALRSVTRR